MFKNYHDNPILGVYYYPRGDWSGEQIRRDLEIFAQSDIPTIWLFFDPFYDVDDSLKLRQLADDANALGLTIVPALGQFLQLHEHPEAKIVNHDGTTSDDPRYWNMGCFRHPTLLKIATERAIRFFAELGNHPALYRLEGVPMMNFVHETYYRNSVPEFGGDHMKPNCYCEHCLAGWRDYLQTRGIHPDTAAPKDDSDPVLWQEWFIYHAQAIPEFLHNLIQATKQAHPVWSTHECNDFYPASWQSVYTGNDWWRMGAVLDIGHEDMYPLEFDTRYVCYVYDYAKDILRSATGFNKLITANGQAFNSWLGYQLPENSMSEQIYSALAHGALGLVWWTELPSIPPHIASQMPQPPTQTEIEQARYRMISQTQSYNREYMRLVKLVEGYIPEQSPIALVYSWTTMTAERHDYHTYDTLLTYQLLVQLGFVVDILSEGQIINNILSERGYKAVFALGCHALPHAVVSAIDTFVQTGGLLITDYAEKLVDEYPTLYPQWRKSGHSPRTYNLSTDVPVAVYIEAQHLSPPSDATIHARFNDNHVASFSVRQKQGTVCIIGSYLGWDYTTYPGYYDLGKMFPFQVRQDEHLRHFIGEILATHGIAPPIRSDHADIEVAVWHHQTDTQHIVFAINHLQSEEYTTIHLPLSDGDWRVYEALSDAPIEATYQDGVLSWQISLIGLQGIAFHIQTK
ncbi:MAG: hypothetical protein MUE54_05335 [Anaerolineae bacterium]|jgi:hypothetical protein|nr:hypothetical protein [Anaerolineae bacterium]